MALPLACKRASTGTATSQPSSPSAADFISQHNIVVGMMGQFEFDKALAGFEQLAKSRPDDADVKTNLAIATLNRQREGDSAKALEVLDGVLAKHPDHARARYCRGILLLHGGKPAEALEAFGGVTKADPKDAYARYHAGQCLLALNKPAEALGEFEAALGIDPQLRSAYYGAFGCLQRTGKGEQAKARLEEFQRLKDNPQARLVEFKYTRMGAKAEVAVVDATPASEPSELPGGVFASPPSPLKITNAAEIPWRKAGDKRPISITAADIDSDGRIDLFITNAWGEGGPVNAVLLRRGDGFELDARHPLTAISDVNAALWGDFDNDTLTDVYLCRKGSNQLWRQAEKGKWQDVTASTKAAGAELDTLDGAFVDADHDGDLDLILARRNGPTELLSNNMDGTFRAIAAEAGIAGDGREAIGIVVADLDSDNDADLIILKRQPPHDVFLNDRQWRYRPDDSLKQFAASPTQGVVAADSDADGQVELFSLWRGVDVWRRSAQGKWDGPSSSEGNTAPDLPGQLAVADVSGSGNLSTVDTLGPRSIEISPIPRGRRIDRLSHVSSPFPWTVWSLVVLDAGAGPSIVAMSPDGGPPVIKGPGEKRPPFAALWLTGKQNQADQMRSNASGIGAKIAARIDSRWVAASTHPKNSSGPGQSLQPICIGLGGASKADFVSITWPDGLRQTELLVPAGKLTVIPETQRQTSSCPVIFAWNGIQWAFITDCLGVGGIGFAAGPPGEFVPPRPWENVLLPDGAIKPSGGEYRLKLSEPMEEACYLDAARLVAYDLPSGWSMTLDERMGVNDPQPTGKAVFFQRFILPISAANDRAENATAAIAKADHVAAEPGKRDPRFVGFCREHWLTLKFDQPLDGAGGEPVLVIDGWVEYPYSQTMFAAWQAGVTYDAPTLEARGADGKWVVVLEHFGYPAGMPRQMSVPIPRQKLPPGTRELRLRTNLEVYWDRIAVAWSEACPEAKRIELPLRRALLAETGFARRQTFAQRRPFYDYSKRDPLWDAAHQDGFYTAFGAVQPLVQKTDDAVAIFGPGEEVELGFEERSPAPPAGWQRSWVLELAGWCKDRDLYTRDGQTLEPLPKRGGSPAASERDRLHQRFNTRYRSGGGGR
jgi:tetratricopeptide (TPR) repeat protein